MKKTVSKLLEGQTKNITDLKNFMFAKDYWKAVDKNSDSVENAIKTVSYTHLRAHETPEHLVCRLLLEKKKKF